LDLQFTFFPQEGEINVFPPTAFLIEITWSDSEMLQIFSMFS
jgi:hypothetical protein